MNQFSTAKLRPREPSFRLGVHWSDSRDTIPDGGHIQAIAPCQIFTFQRSGTNLLTDPNGTPSNDATPLLQLKGVSKHYADGDVDALVDVSLSIQPAEFVAIVGPSGGGKSTLLNMLGALDVPTRGEVWFEGKRLSDLPSLDQFRAHKIGFIFQSYRLLPNLTAQENVQLTMFDTHPNVSQRKAEAIRLLKRVGLGERVNHRADKLSIGQRQRVAIARAIAGNPPLILADEPTGALDTERGNEVMDLLDELRQEEGATLVVVTHDERIAGRADRVVYICDGRLQTV
ncbi:MAG: ABC transporter ATP-binding protein [Rhodopirellula sp. JB055]|uniref:ABC transporter ATP-binding protein n=1 Tax=Rhodopirellula sp. JB055 TaxID=3342846 RepID=UPI003709E5D2